MKNISCISSGYPKMSWNIKFAHFTRYLISTWHIFIHFKVWVKVSEKQFIYFFCYVFNAAANLILCSQCFDIFLANNTVKKMTHDWWLSTLLILACLSAIPSKLNALNVAPLARAHCEKIFLLSFPECYLILKINKLSSLHIQFKPHVYIHQIKTHIFFLLPEAKPDLHQLQVISVCKMPTI